MNTITSIKRKIQEAKAKYFSEKDVALVCAYFNPNHYKSRYVNYMSFITGIRNSKIRHLTIEAAFGEDEFELSNSPNIIKVRARDVMWQKEALLNIGAKKLIKEGYKKIIFADADVIFLDKEWPDKISKALDKHDVCQCFSTYSHNEKNDFGAISKLYRTKNWNNLKGEEKYLHPGFIWAFKASVLENIGYLYEKSILGGGDSLIFFAVIKNVFPERFIDYFPKYSERNLSERSKKDYLIWAEKLSSIINDKVGFVDIEILSLWHGDLKNRKYQERNKILIENQFDPDNDVKKDENGCLKWTSDKKKLHSEIREYFISRNEDG